MQSGKPNVDGKRETMNSCAALRNATTSSQLVFGTVAIIFRKDGPDGTVKPAGEDKGGQDPAHQGEDKKEKGAPLDRASVRRRELAVASMKAPHGAGPHYGTGIDARVSSGNMIHATGINHHARGGGFMGTNSSGTQSLKNSNQLMGTGAPNLMNGQKNLYNTGSGNQFRSSFGNNGLHGTMNSMMNSTMNSNQLGVMQQSMRGGGMNPQQQMQMSMGPGMYGSNMGMMQQSMGMSTMGSNMMGTMGAMSTMGGRAG